MRTMLCGVVVSAVWMCTIGCSGPYITGRNVPIKSLIQGSIEPVVEESGAFDLVWQFSEDEDVLGRLMAIKNVVLEEAVCASGERVSLSYFTDSERSIDSTLQRFQSVFQLGDHNSGQCGLLQRMRVVVDVFVFEEEAVFVFDDWLERSRVFTMPGAPELEIRFIERGVRKAKMILYGPYAGDFAEASLIRENGERAGAGLYPESANVRMVTMRPEGGSFAQSLLVVQYKRKPTRYRVTFEGKNLAF